MLLVSFLQLGVVQSGALLYGSFLHRAGGASKQCSLDRSGQVHYPRSCSGSVFAIAIDDAYRYVLEIYATGKYTFPLFALLCAILLYEFLKFVVIRLLYSAEEVGLLFLYFEFFWLSIEYVVCVSDSIGTCGWCVASGALAKA